MTRLNRRGEQHMGREYALETAIVNGTGQLRIGDRLWLALGPDLPAGTRVRVAAVEGVAGASKRPSARSDTSPKRTSRTILTTRSNSMEIKPSLIRRLIGLATNTTLRLTDADLSVHEPAGALEIPLNRIVTAGLSPGFFSAHIALQLADGTAPRWRGFAAGAAERFVRETLTRRDASAAAWRKEHYPAIARALATFDTLAQSGRYLRRTLARAWEKDHRRWSASELRAMSTGDTDRARAAAFERLATLLENFPAWVDAINKRYCEKILARDAAFFDRFGPKPLTPRQREAVVTDEDATLVVAGAGSGKTSVMAAKAAYLVHAGLAQPREILMLAFNTHAAKELTARVEQAAAHGLGAQTFHSFGNGVLKYVEGVGRNVSKLATDKTQNAVKLTRFIESLIETNPEFCRLAVTYLADHLYEYRSAFEFNSLKEYENHVRSVELRTLRGEQVRSFEECEIANFLARFGVAYDYEPQYAPTGDRLRYCPDFHITGTDIYIEHFGVDREGRTAPGVDREMYARGMTWKRDLHRQHGTTLIETYSWERWDGALLPNLTRRLAAAGVELKAVPEQTLLKDLCRKGRYSALAELMERFLRHYKQHPVPREALLERAARQPNQARAVAFLDLFMLVFAEYEAELKRRSEIDFEDMISRATQYLEESRYRSPYRFILVDEFQDISDGRFRLLQALLRQVAGSRLFAVGDDWQAIYRFAGGRLALMTGLAEDNVGLPTRRVFLDKTFRFNDRLSAVASRFVMRNDAQIAKTIETVTRADCSAITIMKRPPRRQAWAVADALAHIEADMKRRDLSGASVLLLARYNDDKHRMEAQLTNWRRRFPSLKLKVDSMHKSKGLEADYTVVIGLSGGGDGVRPFPSLREDDPVLALVLPELEKFPHAEERRLFYVALTRARHHVYLIACPEHPSVFVREIEDEGYDVQQEPWGQPPTRPRPSQTRRGRTANGAIDPHP